MVATTKHASPDSPETTYLFVPGTHPHRFERALNSGADNVIIDLEDAVSVEEKDQALENTLSSLKSGLSKPAFVRVNTIDSPWFSENVAELVDLARSGSNSLKGIVLPKVETAASVGSLRGLLPDHVQIIGLIETAAGVHNAVEIASAEGLTRLAVGAVDLSEDLSAESDSTVIDFVYAQIVIASRLSKIKAPLASPPMALRDPAVIEANARRFRGMGLGGHLCIHPDQVDPIHLGFAPNKEEIEWAIKVVDSVGGAVQVDGQMVDKPVREKAQRILSQSRRGF